MDTTAHIYWKINTSGVTGMHWFYPEEKAPRIARRPGLALTFFGVLLAGLLILRLHGPNPFARMRQARTATRGKTIRDGDR